MAARISARRSTGMPRSLRGPRPRGCVGGWRSTRRPRRPSPTLAGVVADVDVDALGPEPLEPGRLLQVGARDPVAHRREHRRDGAHAGAADADDVDRHRLRRGRCAMAQPVPSAGRATASTRAATRSAASGRAAAAHGRGHRGPAGPGRRRSPSSSAAEPVDVELGVGDDDRTARGRHGTRRWRSGGRGSRSGAARGRPARRARPARRTEPAGAGDRDVGGLEQQVHAVLVLDRLVEEPPGPASARGQAASTRPVSPARRRGGRRGRRGRAQRSTRPRTASLIRRDRASR